MNTDLSHLPQNKQDDLRRIVSIVRERCPAVAMIILFGSYARGDWREEKDLAPDRKSGHASDYDILVLVGNRQDCDTTMRRAIEDAGINGGFSAMPRFIFEDVDYVNLKLERGQYFFTDIVSEGRLLFDSKAFQLSAPRELSSEERLRVAEEDFTEWFESSEQFFELYKVAMQKGWNKKSAFNLHQAAEASYKTLLILFTNYIPNEHYLGILGMHGAKIDPVFNEIFPKETKFQEDALLSLEYAYIGARYDKHYRIDRESLEYLEGRVVELMGLTRKHCEDKLQVLRSAANGSGIGQ